MSLKSGQKVLYDVLIFLSVLAVVAGFIYLELANIGPLSAPAITPVVIQRLNLGIHHKVLHVEEIVILDEQCMVFSTPTGEIEAITCTK